MTPFIESDRGIAILGTQEAQNYNHGFIVDS